MIVKFEGWLKHCVMRAWKMDAQKNLLNLHAWGHEGWNSMTRSWKEEDNLPESKLNPDVWQVQKCEFTVVKQCYLNLCYTFTSHPAWLEIFLMPKWHLRDLAAAFIPPEPLIMGLFRSWFQVCLRLTNSHVFIFWSVRCSKIWRRCSCKPSWFIAKPESPVEGIYPLLPPPPSHRDAVDALNL